MQYTHSYESPLGRMLLASDGAALTGLWFVGQKYYAAALDKQHKNNIIFLILKFILQNLVLE